MLELKTDYQAIVFKNGTSVKSLPINSVSYECADNNTIVFINTYNKKCIASEIASFIKLNNETLTAANCIEKLNAALFE